LHSAFLRTEHRPWPLPPGRWTWRQSWCDLLFAHWAVPAKALRPFIPDRLALQEFDGTAWIGIVPFRMEGVMRRPLPDVPGISAFPELNVRTYVELDGRPGVWFFSLDATNPFAVWAARRFFHLPYFRAHMTVTRERGGFLYKSRRAIRDPGMGFEATFRPSSPVYEASPGTLEHWLTERYCLYAHSPRHGLSRTEVHHPPWPLQHAEAEILDNEMLSPFGMTLAPQPDLLHFSRRLDVVVWSPTPLTE